MQENNQVKILMVDDRAENLFALEVILSSENYECMKASSGPEALSILEDEKGVAVILMDVQMPVMDGFETVERIRQIEKYKHVPIIFLTASMDTSVNIFTGYQTGAVDYMIKPISPEILKAKVAVFVDLFVKTTELIVETREKEKHATELMIAKRELAFQKKEKEKQRQVNKELEAFSYSLTLLSRYSLSLIEASLDPLVTINTEGKIMDMNEALAKITGIDRKKLIGSDFFDYFTEKQMAREVYQEVFAKGFVTDYPLTLRHKKGKLTDVLFNGSVYKDDKENVLGVVIVARDVTDQKRIAKELTEAKESAELATKIAEEAKNKAEIAAQISQDAMKSKQQFLSNMSHEIRTPMNAIIGFTKVVLKTELSAKQKEY